MRIFITVHLLFLLLPFKSVMAQKFELEAMVMEFQKVCPMSIGAAGELENVEFDGKNVVFVYSLNEGIMNFDAIQENPDLIKVMMANPNDGVRRVFGLVLDRGCGFGMRMIEKETGKSAKVMFKKEEMENIFKTGSLENDPVKILEAKIAVDNMQLPFETEEGVMFTKTELAGDYVVHKYVVDESLYSFDALKDIKSELKKNYITALTTDPVVKNYARLCKNAGKGVKYQYVGAESGDEFVIEVSIYEF